MLKIEHLKKHYDNFSLDCSLELTTRQDRFYNQSFYSYCITQNRQYHTAYSKRV